MCGGVIPLVVLVLLLGPNDLTGDGNREGQGARLEHLRLVPRCSLVVELSLSIVPLSTTMFRFRFQLQLRIGFGLRSPCRDRND